jgi:hypothetical protein
LPGRRDRAQLCADENAHADIVPGTG